MKRIIDDQLVEWKNRNRRKPLILRGARQVGKTYSLKFFGKKHFSETVFIDFEKFPEYTTIFDVDSDIQRIISEIEILTQKKLVVGKTLLVLDEIQLSPRAITSLRYFYEEIPELHVIAAGSLLEFAFSQISVPVGRVQFLFMYPMNFYEFLFARNFTDLAEILKEKPKKLSKVIHEKLKTELKKYFFTGGMPECVKVYTESADFIETSQVQSEIINSYRLDFAKYTPKIEINCLNSTLNAIGKSIGKQIKFSRLTSNFSSPTIKKALFMLEKARLIKVIYSVNPPGLPFKFSIKDSVFKAILLDIGLTQHLNGSDFKREFMKTELLNIYNGAIAEQFVGQELFMAQNDELFYWSRQAKSSNAEVDFLAEKNNNILGVEVKSGASGSLKSLHLLLKENPQIKQGIVFSSREYSEIPEQRLSFVPIYYAGSHFAFE
ncbi:MAG: AAA family ATPase [Draconibacterium sp.]|nr:AAA family ATPase [Draconibacterium sp.]